MAGTHLSYRSPNGEPANAISDSQSLAPPPFPGDVSSDMDAKLRRKIDLRLCTIAGVLCSLNLLDSSIISSASVTTMLVDLDLSGNRFSVSIFIFTIASVCFQLPATI